MKYPSSNITFSFYAMCRTGIVASLFVLLAVCAGIQPVMAETQQPAQEIKLTPAARADFVVAMQSIKSVEYEKAIRYFNKVIAQSPNNPVPYINLALVHKKMQNLTLAEESLKLALKFDPENPVANNEYALLYRKTGRFAEARKVYERILDRYPNFIMAHKNLGILCDIYMRDYACALKHYTVYGNFRPDDANVKIWIADMKGR